MIYSIYKVGLYCRLSSDDGNVGDSGSIITQKMILEKYCDENSLEIIDTYVDDGFSGTVLHRNGSDAVSGGDLWCDRGSCEKKTFSGTAELV